MKSKHNGKPRWILVAGNSTRIRRGMPAQWRYRFRGETYERMISGWEVMGEINARNHGQGTNPAADGGGELFAWISYFGTIETDPDGHATIHLHTPPPE